MKDVIIIGGGFSGLVAANAFADKKFENYLILERNDRVGKKILVTGNGRCNLTNQSLDPSNYHGQDPSFCEYAIKKYDNKTIAGFFYKKGLLLTDEDGKIYPLSKVANAVLDTLRLRIADHSVTGCYIDDIAKSGDVFTVRSADGKTFRSKKVIFAFGGKSGQNLGTDGKSYHLAEKFGHKITKLTPSLVQMKTDAFGKGLKGIKHTAKVSLYDDKRLISEQTGDFLITDNGVSGNTVFTLSARLGGLKDPSLKIDFIPEYIYEDLMFALNNKICIYRDLYGTDLLTGYVHSKAAAFFAVKAGIDKLKLKDIQPDRLSNIICLAKGFSAEIKGTYGFEYSQVTHGGIVTTDVDPKTFESRLCRGLYIIGEALDIDGDCGGYNLQWAFSSAMCAAESII